MLRFQEFFTACTGQWKTERTYHSVLEGYVERSYTEFRVEPIAQVQKEQILSLSASNGVKVDFARITDQEVAIPGFAIAFDTRSETGETLSMSLQALFVPDKYVFPTDLLQDLQLPVAAQVAQATEEVIQGFYLRDEGYSETGAVAGRFTYQPTRQTLEMITRYRRSVAVDQMRMVAPDLRLRTIITYERPETESPPSVINLVGFGVERKQVA